MNPCPYGGGDLPEVRTNPDYVYLYHMEALYMLAIMPPEDLREKIQKERVFFAERYNCVKALKPPVHITIYEPFKEEHDLVQRIAPLQKWANSIEPFIISINNYGFFENPKSPVAFIHVIKDEPITQLRTALLKELKKYVEEDEPEYVNNKPVPKAKPQPFNPHFTIGYRDVPPELLPTIKQDYLRRQFKGSFMCDAIHLWRHNGTNWQTAHTFQLAGKQMPAAPTLF